MDELISIPKEKYAPEAIKTKGTPKIENYADKDDAVAKTSDWVERYYEMFASQNQRDKFEDNMDAIDEMYRCSKTRTQVNTDEADVKEATESNVSSTQFYRSLNAITSGETNIMLGNEEQLPVVYEPEDMSIDYNRQEGELQARYRNALLAYTFKADKTPEKIKDTLFFLNKYGIQIIEAAWDKKYAKRMDRIPTAFEEGPDGMRIPTKWKYDYKEKIICDNPTLIRHDIKDCWFDVAIPDIQQQSCVVIRCQKQLGELWQLQKAGDYQNVGKITKDQYYKGENTDNDVKGARQENAGENTDSNSPTTLVDIWTAWVRIPLDDETGKWDTDKQLPHWYKIVLAGAMDGDKICLQLSPNPMFRDDIPLLLAHSHRDDKGAINLSYGDTVKSLYEMETSTINLMFDNQKLRTRKPLIMERGSINIRDKTFSSGGNQVWHKRPGAQDPHEMDIQDTTQQTIPMLNLIQDQFKDTMGTNKPFLGEPMGSRTSASEARIAYEQSVKPALENAKYKAEQILPFIADWFEYMWRVFGAPDRKIAITHENEPLTIMPKGLYGDFSVRVTAIKRFQDSIIRRQEQDQFINQILPLMMKGQVIDQAGLKEFFRQVMMDRDFDNVDKMLATKGDYDARRVARSENYAILFGNVMDLPKPEENHSVHLEEHKPVLGSYTLLPKDQQNPQALSVMKQHVLMHEQMAGGGSTGMEQGGDVEEAGEEQEAPEGMAPQPTEGMATGQPMAAEMGAMENMGAPEMAV